MSGIHTLLKRAGLTLEAAGKLCGVTGRTVTNWRDGKTRVPADALTVLEFAAAAATGTPYTLREQIARLESIQAEQIRLAGHYERLHDEAEADLGRTNQKLNALYAERSRQRQGETQ